MRFSLFGSVRGDRDAGVLRAGGSQPLVHPRLRGACALGSVYGFLQGAWPFGLVEAVWAVVALRRWNVRQREVPDQFAANLDSTFRHAEYLASLMISSTKESRLNLL